MTIINPNSISGISSITALNSTAAINLFKADGTAANIIAGVVTATSFVGSGANLTSLPTQVTIANNADNRVITGGSGVNLNGESNVQINSSGVMTIGNDAAGAATLGGDLNVANTNGGTIVVGDTGSGEYLKLYGSGSGAYVGSKSNHPLMFFTNDIGNERLRIGTAGQLGIAGANYGTSGQVLTSQGASSPIQWATLTTGKVLQFVYTKDGVTSSSNSGGWTDSVESGLNVDITPISATSKILVFMQSVGGNTSSGRSYFLRMRRKVNNTGDTNVASAQLGDGSNGGMQSISMTYVDYDASSPFNTSHVRNYRIRFGQDGSGTARFDYATQSYIYAMEIA